MEHATFLQDLAIIMLVAGVITVIFHRLRQPVVLGYILAGVILGPHTPPMVLIGDKLGLYKAMAHGGPLTSAELARRTPC